MRIARRAYRWRLRGSSVSGGLVIVDLTKEVSGRKGDFLLETRQGERSLRPDLTKRVVFEPVFDPPVGIEYDDIGDAQLMILTAFFEHIVEQVFRGEDFDNDGRDVSDDAASGKRVFDHHNIR